MSSSRPAPADAVIVEEIVRLFEKRYDAAVEALGRFNLAVFGKTGAGKSTLVNAIFGADVAPVGTGRPVTPALTHYVHPTSPIGIYDSRGFETGDSQESILSELRQIVESTRSKPIAEHIHAVWYVLRWSDRRIEDTQADLIRELHALGLPVVVVLSQVPVKEGRHHPDAEAFADYIRSLQLPIRPANMVYLTNAERDDFNGYPVHGLQQLLEGTFRVVPDVVHKALIAAQRIDLARKRSRAITIVSAASVTAGAIGAIPIPFSDAIALVPAQVTMIATISAAYGMNIPKARIAALVGSVVMVGGATGLGRYVATNLLKLVPGGQIVGAAVSGATAALLTTAIGRGWIAVCEQLLLDGGTIDDLDLLQERFKEEVRRNIAGRGSAPGSETPAP